MSSPPRDGFPEDASARPRRSARFVLLAGIIAGLGNVLFIPFVNPDQVFLASDVYLAAAEAFLAGEDIYAATPPGRSLTFLYPPIVILLFVPHALVGSQVGAYTIQVVLHVAAGIGLTAVTVRALRRRGMDITRVDHLLVLLFVVLSAHSAIVLVNGQVTLWLGFAFAVGFDALDRRAESLAGIAFAGAAVIKVFPAAIGLWLVRTRSWRSIAVAIATGLGGLLLGAVLLGPELTATYLTDVLMARYTEETFASRPQPTETVGGIQRQFAAIFGGGSTLVTILGAAILAPLVGYLFLDIYTDELSTTALLGAVVAILLFFPLQRLYLPLLAFPLIVVLYTLSPGRPRQLLVLGTLISFLRPSVGQVYAIVRFLPVPGGVERFLLTAVEQFLVFILLPTLGLWLILGACLLAHYMGPAADTGTTPTGSS